MPLWNAGNGVKLFFFPLCSTDMIPCRVCHTSISSGARQSYRVNIPVVDKTTANNANGITVSIPRRPDIFCSYIPKGMGRGAPNGWNQRSRLWPNGTTKNWLITIWNARVRILIRSCQTMANGATIRGLLSWEHKDTIRCTNTHTQVKWTHDFVLPPPSSREEERELGNR